MAKIYSKKGDKGKTSLLNGQRVSKCDIRIESCGTIDELTSYIGLLKNYIKDKNIVDFLLIVQTNLMTINSMLSSGFKNNNFAILTGNDIIVLENTINKIEEQLSTLDSFIVPGINKPSSICHVVRTICRRAERIIVELSLTEQVNNDILVFINRLSDYFFVLSRLLSDDNKRNKKI